MAITMHSHHVVEKPGKPTPEDAYTALRQQQQSVDCDLLTRTSWTDARLALHQIKKVRCLHPHFDIDSLPPCLLIYLSIQTIQTIG